MFICLSIGVADLGALTPHYPEFPYFADSLEREPYRGQFHFSLQGGWMNDINGLWYYKGEYHMTFQHFPHGLSWNQMHWGHAVSIDMLHWVQKPIALEPGVTMRQAIVFPAAWWSTAPTPRASRPAPRMSS